jgi:VanZ family protein
MKNIIILIRPYGKVLLVIWVLTILGISSVPNLPSPKINTGGLRIRLDYLFHFLEYGLLAFLTYLTFVKKGFEIRLKMYSIITIALFLFALADEFHQRIIPGRAFNEKDIISNMTGIVAALIFCSIMFRKISKGLDL